MKVTGLMYLFLGVYLQDLVDDLRVLAPMNEEIILSLLLSGEVYDAASLYAHFNVSFFVAVLFTGKKVQQLELKNLKLKQKEKLKQGISVG